MRSVSFAVVLLSATAAAEPPCREAPGPVAVASARSSALPLAVGINLPIGWGEAASIGASLFIGVTEHDAIRANVATYQNDGSLLGTVFAVAGESDGDEAAYSGRTTDLGIAWTRFPRALWSGGMYEVGVVRRARDLRVEDELAAPQVLATDTTTYAGRLHVGWSWLFERHLFVAVAIGASLGYEAGTETHDNLLHTMPTRHDVSRYDISGEAYLRVGVAR